MDSELRKVKAGYSPDTAEPRESGSCLFGCCLLGHLAFVSALFSGNVCSLTDELVGRKRVPLSSWFQQKFQDEL
jgi:hypothetical protein